MLMLEIGERKRNLEMEEMRERVSLFKWRESKREKVRRDESKSEREI